MSSVTEASFCCFFEDVQYCSGLLRDRGLRVEEGVGTSWRWASPSCGSFQETLEGRELDPYFSSVSEETGTVRNTR